MRHKFRGQAAHDNPTCGKGEWVYGGATSTVDGIYYIVKAEREMWEDKMSVKFNAIQVIPETVGQFTGLCDKNGKEAYHKHWYKRSDGQTGCIRNFVEDTYHLIDWIREGGTFEIIGNTHTGVNDESTN